MNWKDFFYYQKGTRAAILLLLILIVLTLILNTLLIRLNRSEILLIQNDSIINEFAEFKESIKVNEYTTSRGKKQNRTETYKTQRKQENSFTKHSPSFPKSVNDSNVSKTDSSQRYNNTETNNQNSYCSNYHRVEKLKVGETISLNITDTTQWKKIPGIGSSYASRIVKYRDLLGGYVRKEQLMEVYGVDSELYSQIEPYIVEDSNYLKLNVNEMEFRDMLRHPYLNYKQVQAIVNLRDKKGDIVLIEELAMLDVFTAEDIARLELYLQFSSFP